MTKVLIDPGVCGFLTKVTADSEDQQEVKVHISSGCKPVQDMMETLGDTFDAYEICLVKPGEGPFYEYVSKHFPVHAGCPVIAGITKCIEAECALALKRDVSIRFLSKEDKDR